MGNNSYSQSAKLSLDLKNATLKELIEAIESQSSFIFVYYDSVVDLEKPINVNVTNQSVEKILNKVFKSTDKTYRIYDRQIVIGEKELLTDELSVHPVELQATQDEKIKGKITDDEGKPLPGVTITIVGTTRGVITDNDGTYSIEARPTDKLVFSFIGMESQIVEVGEQEKINIILKAKSQELEDIVVVGFGKQKKEDLIGSVVAADVPELRKTSSSNVTTMLAGNIAGMISYQRSGEPGQDNAEFFIRGVTTFGYKKDPLILIDGIEVSTTDLARMQPDDIANFSIMKDATSTAVYGARGANGVISITTKEGSEGSLSISVRAENAFSMPTRKVELADPITYMRLGNEAVKTRDPLGTSPYSQTKIDNTILGTNKYVYPATDWYEEMFNNYATTQRVNLNASGGGKVARYYLAATFNQDNGNLKVDKRSNFNNNVQLSTYSFRSNINMNLTKTTEAALRVVGNFDDYTGPINGGSEVYKQVMRANPVLFPPYYEPDEANIQTQWILFGNYGEEANYINPYAEMVRGYKDYSRSKIDAQFELKQDLSFLTEGLSIRGLFNTSRYSYFDVQRFYNPFYYTVSYYDKYEDDYTLMPLNELTGTDYLGYKEGNKYVNSSTYIELMGNYNCTFAEKHTVSGMLVYTLRNELTGNAGDLQLSLPHRNLGLSGRATYSYKGKYFGEFNFGYNGSERFHVSKRWGFFPSAGVAWTVTNEDFWNIDPISNLKFRATYGLVGNDAIGSDYDRFYYLSKINMNSSARSGRFGIPGSYYSLSGIEVNRSANEDITWEIARKTNVGFELGLFDKFSMEADYFYEHRTNILMDRASIPSTMGLQSVERANVGEASSQGVDGSIDYTTTLRNDIWFKARANFTFATSKFLVYEEPDYVQEYRKHKGYSLSQQWGLIAERMFIDDAEVANSPLQQFGDYMAGDIKYSDVSGDGKISEEDMVPIGFPTDPEIMYGFGISMGYKNFDFSCFFQGSARSSFWIDATVTSPFVNDKQLLKAYAESYWSEEYQDVYALWPRLSSTNIANNTRRNTWFMRDGSFLRLKSLEIGYTLPTTVLQKIGLKNARIYMNGTNLFCLSKFKLWDVEMGGNGLGYPIQKTYNMGITVSF
uniref:TonB-dependent receptor n=1 Tax=uncultured Draconibacterium sp. TaxID=1573823 RepID=UPI003216C96D